MKLTDLDGRFAFGATKTGSSLSDGNTVEGMQGVMFQCPSCGAGKEIVVDHERETGGRPRRFIAGAHYIRVFFANPRGVDVAPPDADLRNDGTPNPRWTMSGTSLDDLTLTPSINCDIPWTDKDGVAHPSSCKYHGFVTNGEVT
jgi:predicted RNA-binding Zn-ribbon protein involved in translation (DUF1610 family)